MSSCTMLNADKTTRLPKIVFGSIRIISKQVVGTYVQKFFDEVLTLILTSKLHLPVMNEERPLSFNYRFNLFIQVTIFILQSFLSSAIKSKEANQINFFKQAIFYCSLHTRIYATFLLLAAPLFNHWPYCLLLVNIRDAGEKDRTI